MKSDDIAEQLDKVLEGLDTHNPDLAKEIRDLTLETARVAYLCLIGQESVAKVYIKHYIAPRIEQLIAAVGEEEKEATGGQLPLFPKKP